MNLLVSFCALFAAAVLPDAALLPGISGESTATGVSFEGRQWVRILETDYAVLKVETVPSVPMTAYDNSGSALAVSRSGEPLVLSAYSDYWFWVMAQTPEPVEFRVTYVHPGRMRGSAASSALSSASMAEIWTFTAPSEGRFNFILTGPGDSSDLDLELYGPGNVFRAGSYSANSFEKAATELLLGEEAQIVISRYNKGGSGEYALEVIRMGELNVLTETASGDASSGNNERWRIHPERHETLVELVFQNAGDLDLYLLGPTGNTVYSSNTYSSSETLLMPAGGGIAAAEVRPFEIGDEGPFPFWLSRSGPPVDLLLDMPAVSETGSGRPALFRFISPETGFYTVTARFEKLRDGDLRLFTGYGESSVFLSSEQGIEAAAVWVSLGDTLWIEPLLIDSRSTGFTLTVAETSAEFISGRSSGRMDASVQPQHFHLVQGRGGSNLVIELRGRDPELDLDMLVSGPGYVLQAEGGASPADNPADESVALYCSEDAAYAVTVYAYERGVSGGYTLEAELIPAETLTGTASPGDTTWALVVGISGYESAVDRLYRASMDAIEFYRFLRDTQGTDPDRIALLVDAEATIEAFTDKLQRIIDMAGPDHRLFVFFSGHGSQEHPGSGGPLEADGRNETLCFYDGDLSDDRLAVLLDGFPGNVFVFIDACHSGGFVNDFSTQEGVLVLAAAREDMSVSERILTPILLSGSRGQADSDGNGVVTAGELVDYVDGILSRVCPVCDAVVDQGMVQCPECETVLKGEYRIARPEQGLFMPGSTGVWTVR